MSINSYVLYIHKLMVLTRGGSPNLFQSRAVVDTHWPWYIYIYQQMSIIIANLANLIANRKVSSLVLIIIHIQHIYVCFAFATSKTSKFGKGTKIEPGLY